MLRTVCLLIAFCSPSVFPTLAVAQMGRHLGYVPQHEKLIAKARSQARADWKSGAIRGDGFEPEVISEVDERPTGSGAAQASYDEVAHPHFDAPYHEEYPMEVLGEGIEGGCVGGCGGCSPACDGSAGWAPPSAEGYCGPGGCGGFDGCDCGACGQCVTCFPNLFRCRSVEVFWGVHGFTGPVNQGGTGSFGFHEGINIGTKIPRLFCGEWGAQFGVRGAHSNFSGSLLTDESRNQMFFTAGVYRRVDRGIQVGLVLDYLSDDWYIDTDLTQLRGEASWVMHGAGELGFTFRSGLTEETVAFNNQILTLEPTDIYALFYRHRFIPCGVGEGRLFAGFSGEGDGLLGSDFRMPLTHSLGLEGGWNFLIPEQPANQGGLTNEGWNLFLNLVWQPGCPPSDVRNYYRPLFRVADNGSFFTDFR